MLSLPSDWQHCSIRYVVEHLLRQAEAVNRYWHAAHAITGASLEVMLAGPLWTARKERKCIRSYSRGWRIDRWVFYVLPRIDTAALIELGRSLRNRCTIDVLAPPRAEQAARHAVQLLLPRWSADVYSIDDYVGLRVVLPTIDAERRHADGLEDLLHRYARLAKSTPEIALQGMRMAD